MTSDQLTKVKKFSKPFYIKTGKYHGWNHVLAVEKNAILIFESVNGVNKKSLLAAIYLHDIGRTVKDEGHAKISYVLAESFLKEIKMSDSETEIIKDSIVSHDISKIQKSKTLEARILFDADKIEILSVRGFLRVLMFLVEERKMSLISAINFLWKYVNEVYNKHLFTKLAKTLVKKDILVINTMVERFNS